VNLKAPRWIMPHPGMRHAGRGWCSSAASRSVASVGLFEREKRYEQRIIVPAELAVRDDCDGRSDRLADVNLIETPAERIAAHCLADSRVEGVRVLRIGKPDVMPSCRSVGIEIERGRTKVQVQVALSRRKEASHRHMTATDRPNSCPKKP
jgi:dihydroneopterin aldolase